MLKINNKKITILVIVFLISITVLYINILNLLNLENSMVQAAELYHYDNKKQNYSAAYICSLFDELDYKVNQGKGYSEYLNTDGFPTGALLAWSESYLMQSYANMFLATDEVKYLDKLHEHIKQVLANRDDKIGQKDYKSELVPCWGTDKYTKNKEWMHFAVHTGMITYSILEFVRLVRDSGIEKYYDSARSFLQQVDKSIDYHNKDWKIDHYVHPEDFYERNYIIPISQQATIGRSLILLYELTDKEEYFNKTKYLARFIKDNSIKENDTGGYILKQGFILSKNMPESKIVDISHATATIHFAYLCYKNNIVFDKKDMQKFTKTIKQLAINNNNRFPKFLDGTGNFDYEVTAAQYAFLSEFDEEIYTSIIDLFFNHLKIDKTAKYMQEDWWGTVMLSLSRLAIYQSSIESGI